jgi:long-chain acyl-CoA synthetase
MTGERLLASRLSPLASCLMPETLFQHENTMNHSEAAEPQQDSPQTIYHRFQDSADRHADKVALMVRDQEMHYAGITYRELNKTVSRLAGSLQRLGIARGDRVAICSRNRPEWVVTDLAVLKLGGIVVPIYQTLPPAAVAHIINDSGSKLLFAQNAEPFSGREQWEEQCPSLAHVVLFEDPKKQHRGRYDTFSGLLADSPPLPDKEPAGDLAGISQEDAATIVYTSGTTGEPKGAVLTHGNIVSNALAAVKRFRFTSCDVILSYLPLCHMFERTCGYYTFLFAGARIAYAQDMTTIIDDIRLVRPTILIAVPRIIEKVYEAVEQRVRESTVIRRRLVTAAIGSLNEYWNRTYRGQKVPMSLGLKRSFYEFLVAAKFRKIAGGRLRLLVSGGAALDRKIEKTLHILGFNIIQGYGLTETSPVVTCRSVEDNRLGTVGKPLDGVEVRIAENDEILVRGPNVMQGYFQKPEETRAAIDEQGWLHTGDRGRFDADGNLIITGRIKELIVTSYGKNVAPIPIENMLTGSTFVEQSVLIGDGRKYITALIVPRKEMVERFAAERNIPAEDYAALLDKPAIRELFAAEIARTTADLSGFEQIKGFTLLPEPFTVENGLLTPTLKVRRGKILKRYRLPIEHMYEPRAQGP